ncbi:MAG: dTDP-4-dehydrorhamnose 3,5-epimerase family protein [Planctomycetota bacterium]
MIHGVKVKQLKVTADERGRLMEILRRDEELFEKFGQVYVTTAYPGVVKGWHFHRRQTDHFACVKGMMKLVLYDRRENSPTKGEVNEFFLGEHNPILVKIPPLVLHGFKGVGTEEAVVVNTPTEPYDHAAPDEERLDPRDPSIPYDWSRKDR